MQDTRRKTACTCSQRDRLGAMECAAVEVDHRDHPWLPLRVHAGRRVMTAEREHRRVGDLDLDRISRELGLGTYELEATLLAHRAAAAVATHEPARAKALLAGTDDDFIVRSLEAFDTMAALDLDSDGERVSGEDALEMLHLGSPVGCRPGPVVGTSTATNRCCCSRTGCPRSGRPARGAAIRTPSIQVSAGQGHHRRHDVATRSVPAGRAGRTLRCSGPRVLAFQTGAASGVSADPPVVRAPARRASRAAARRPGTGRPGRPLR